MRFAADENFKGIIIKALLRRFPDLDIVRVQDPALYQAPVSSSPRMGRS